MLDAHAPHPSRRGSKPIFYTGKSEIMDDEGVYLCTYGAKVTKNKYGYFFPGNIDPIGIPASDLSEEEPQSLPTGLRPWDKVKITLDECPVDAVVVGPASDDSKSEKVKVMLFDDPNPKLPDGYRFGDVIDVPLDKLTKRTEGKLPDGSEWGENIYVLEALKSRSGCLLAKYSVQGRIWGPAKGELGDMGVAVLLPGICGSIEVPLNKLSKHRPGPLPGEHEPWMEHGVEEVYYKGKTTDRMKRGERVAPVGPAPEGEKGQRIEVLSIESDATAFVYISELSETEPGSDESDVPPEEENPSPTEKVRREPVASPARLPSSPPHLPPPPAPVAHAPSAREHTHSTRTYAHAHLPPRTSFPAP